LRRKEVKKKMLPKDKEDLEKIKKQFEKKNAE